MAGLVPAIHVLFAELWKGVDAGHKAGHAPESRGLIETGLALPQALDAAAALLFVDALALGGLGHLGGPARLRLHRRLLDQRDQPLARVLAIAHLVAILLRDDDDDALF